MTKIAVIIGSVREGRVSDKLAKWVAKEVEKVAEVETIDLVDYPMPFMDDPVSPRYNPNRQPKPAVKQWLEKMAKFDGYVFVTPEYNRSTSGVLKNAIDQLDYQLEDKPVALVGHGSTGGAQAIATLRMSLPPIGAITIPQVLYFTNKVGEEIDETGVLKDELRNQPSGLQSSLEAQAKSLVWYAETLAKARKNRT